MNNESLKDRKNEKGAALVTVLMVTLILLVASAGLLLESTMNTANVTDAISEEQAYVAAESGIQSVVNVLRGNRDTYMNSNLLDTSKSSTDTVNLINYIRALKPASSNLASDTSAEPRLSRWLEYDSTYTDRVVLGDRSTYAPRTGNAFSLEISDPDETGDSVTFYTSGRVGGTTNSTVTVGAGSNTLVFSYNAKSLNTIVIPGESFSTNIGSFDINIPGGDVTLTEDIRFDIVYKMTNPYEATKVVRGYIKLPRDSDNNSLPTTVNASNFATSGIKLHYNSVMYDVRGSLVTLTGGTIIADPLGYELTPVLGNNVINCNIAPTEPIRLSIKATGYGPRGSKKTLEAIIQKNFFNNMTAPATLTMVGSSTGFVFNPGNSTVVVYSGDDIASSVLIPPVGTTNDPNLLWVETQFATGEGWKANVYGDPVNVNDELPEWLWSPGALDGMVNNLKNTATASGNYYTSGNGPEYPGNYATGKGITFVDGDYEISHNGGGLLIVTGKLTLHGNFGFKGMIIVTGAEGMDRRGGGNATIQGNVVLAPYSTSDLSAFLPPKYDMSGGGTSDLRYDSNSVANGMTAVSNFVIGVAEK